MDEKSSLRDLTIAAHGGLDRWNGYTSLTAHLRNGGGLWALKDGVLADANVRVDLHRQFARDVLLVSIDLDGITFE
jgi:hypothetical protein